ncbi:hypothetical protein [Nitratireductor basaltis]|uniref:F5/8 type C domain-containing protein n=1 Tax=Nitratireductor basaltis TaxID=472175 RepID=A0A084UDJ3_9HYPH|nr:hypothetical protein [Nitratireductor basaltis]KFB11029.1 hypothetical protein EL18_02071 [Nitratireductor basaltis]
MSFYLIQSTFNRGEISPLLGSRADVDFWRQSLFYCRNFQILTHGGLRRRSGSRFVTEVDSSAQITRLFPFSFSETQSYVLELSGSGYLRFLANRGVVQSGGSPYRISHSYAGSDLFRLSYAQFNDVAYFAHKNYTPQKLLRSAETNWSISAAVFEDGPYLDRNTTATTLEPSATGGAVPKMTGATTPSGTVSGTAPTTGALWQLFDRDDGQVVNWNSLPVDVQYNFGGSSKVVDGYWILGPKSSVGAAPTSWVFQGYNGTDWITLDSVSGETGWTGGEYRYFNFQNETAYQAYRFQFKGNNGLSSGTLLAMYEIALHERAANQTPFNLTASSTAGINNGAGFSASDVGRSIRFLGADGRWNWMKITSFVSSTTVKVILHDQALPDVTPSLNWSLGAFASSTGWPAAVTLYNERLMWARTSEKPVTVYGSKQGNFEDYGVSDPLRETDGINITLLSSNMNEILWIVDDEDLITGSAKQVRTVGPSDITQSFSATNITQRKGPNSGASHVQPISIGGVVLYVGAGGTKIRELVLGEQNRYVAPELSLIGEHYFKDGIVDWAFSEKPDPIIYAVTGDGLLVAITYDREQRVLGFSRHDFGGFVESVAVIPGTEPGHDDVYLVIKRTINGATKRYVEVMENAFDPQSDAVEDAFFVDCGLSYSGAATMTITGLSHLEGESVVALADGNVVEGLTVASGQITLPYAASKVHVGLAMKSRAVTVPISGPQQDGTLFGRRKTNLSAYVDVYGSGALQMGAYAGDRWTPALTDVLLATGDELFGNKVELQTGFKRADIEGSWTEGDGQIVMETDKPLPLIIRSLMLQNESEP